MAALGCRFMTAFHALTARGEVGAGDRVAVHGHGGVGLSTVHIADAPGARVVAVDIRDAALGLAMELGADAVVNARGKDGRAVTGAVRSETGGGAHASTDALGVAETCRNSMFCLRRRGTHVQLGLTTGEERAEASLSEVPDRLAATTDYETTGVEAVTEF